MQLIQTSRFTNNTVSLRALVPLDSRTISGWNVLVWMIRSATEAWPDRQTFTEALGRAYSMHVRCGLTGYGAQAALEVVFEWIRPDLIRDPAYPAAVQEVMEQVLFHPCLTAERLEEALYMIRARLLRQQEDPDTAAVLAAVAAAGEGTSLAVPISGTLEGLESVTLDEVRHLWKTWLDMPKSLYAVGDLLPEMQRFLDGLLQTAPVCTPHSPLTPREMPAVVREVRDIAQTSLVQGYTTQITLSDPESAALMVLSSILGSGQKSLLFEEIRERHSWCYSISCSLIRFDGLLLVTAGTRAEYLEDLQSEIARQIRRIADDDYPQSLFDAAILDLVDGISARRDFPRALIETAFQQDLLDLHRTDQEQIARLRRVTRRDVQETAQKLQLAVTSIVQEGEADEQD